jgi:hypothetical protein
MALISQSFERSNMVKQHVPIAHFKTESNKISEQQKLPEETISSALKSVKK